MKKAGDAKSQRENFLVNDENAILTVLHFVLSVMNASQKTYLWC